MTILDKIPYPIIIILAIMLAIVPLGGEPHLVEKLQMLISSSLSKPIDIFDLLLHSSPSIILLLKIYRTLMHKRNDQAL